MGFYFNSYKVTSKSPVVAFKNGGFGFNIQNNIARENLVRELEAFDRYVESKRKEKQNNEKGNKK